ncbi:putative nuclease HARBI1 isoform X1 [Phycodurus eques]|uniref:putative nuclease HARBI1 isoform X1 n=2 Tax=Phycodurus eques TaxID=693459 RepID=UPI002ACDD830|nr:putative nuclease HARBI1 isoform X1 [Phycodurus eques]
MEEDDERLRPLVFLMTYMLLKRRRDLNNTDVQRRNEIQRRLRQRQYFFQRQRRMMMMMMAGSIRSNAHIRTRPWTTVPSTDWWERVVMTEFQPSDWLDKFRMSRETFFYLCEKLRSRLTRQDTSFRLALPVEKRVAVALWRLASNVEYRTISALFGVGKSTVCKCVRDMCHSIVALLRPDYLRTPAEPELEESARLFLSQWGFPHCVAAVATLHTAIITPSSNASDYINPAGWLSVLSQVTVNGRGQIWDMCACFPGGIEPAEILQKSLLWTTATEGGLSPVPPSFFMGRQLGYVLLGEPCYPLQSWLLKAYPEKRGSRANPAMPSERQNLFNRRLRRARRVAQEALLRLKARWQCLSKRNDCGLDVVPTMIRACCILHNVCESHGDAFNGEWLAEVAEAESPQPAYAEADADTEQSWGEEVRELFCDYFQQND